MPIFSCFQIFWFNILLVLTLTNEHFFESFSHAKQSMTVILIYNEIFWEISWNNFNHFFPTFGLAEFVYILRQCYQFAFLYCKIGQISTLIFGQNLQKSPQRRRRALISTNFGLYWFWPTCKKHTHWSRPTHNYYGYVTYWFIPIT